MEAYEFDCEDVYSLVEDCYSMVCKEIGDNPAFEDIMSFTIGSVCSRYFNFPPKHIKIEVSDDKKELTVSDCRKDKEFMGGIMNNCIAYNRSTLRLAPDGNIHIISLKNKAILLKEFESKCSGIRLNNDKMPFISSQCPAIYRMYSSFHAFNNKGIEVAFAEYKDFCPRPDTNFDSLEEESLKHCPTEWHLDKYPSDIHEGCQEYYPFRAYCCRDKEKFGIISCYEKGYTTGGFEEKISKYVCDSNYPNQIPDVIGMSPAPTIRDYVPYMRTVNGEVVISPESYREKPGLSIDQLEKYLNNRFINEIEARGSAYVALPLRINSITSAKQKASNGEAIVETREEPMGQIIQFPFKRK